MRLQSLASLALSTAIAVLAYPRTATSDTHGSLRQIEVDASSVVGRLKNLQGTNNGDTRFAPSSTTESLHDFQPEIFSTYRELGVEHVEIYILPEIFLGWNRTGKGGDALDNANYNWTIPDQYIRQIVSVGAKASILFSEPSDSKIVQERPDLLTKVGFMITDRYVNGANGSCFKDAIELFDFYQEPDIYNDQLVDNGYDWHFQAFKAFSQGVARASSKAGVGAWSGNRIFSTNASYQIPDRFVSQFYQDCQRHEIKVKAATFHSVQTQFSFDPYDIVRVTNNIRDNILRPAGLGDIEIWISEFFLSGIPILPSSASALHAFNDPAFWASFALGATMYGQDTSISQIMQWPGFGYGGNGATGFSFPGFFNRSANGGPPIPLNAARAFLLQAQLVSKTRDRLAVHGHSQDGFAVLAGRSNDTSMVQVLVNNYQLDYDIPRELAKTAASAINVSTAASPILQPNGLLNGEAFCLNSINSVIPAPICITYPTPTIRNNTSNSYHLRINNLPWKYNQAFNVEIQRVAATSTNNTVLTFSGIGKSFDLILPIKANEQDLVIISKKA